MLVGCASFTRTPGDPANYAPAVRQASEEGTKLAVGEHPEWAPAFLAAADELDVLSRQAVIDFNTVFQIVDKLPVKELKSRDAQLWIAGGKITLALVSGIIGNMEVQLDRVEKYRVIVLALRDGIRAGLGAPPVGFKPAHAPGEAANRRFVSSSCNTASYNAEVQSHIQLEHWLQDNRLLSRWQD